MKRLAGLLIAAMVASGVASGCGAPDRKAVADQLNQAIKEMPGVADSAVSYSNDVGNGATVHIWVYLPDASPKQIEDVVARINAVRGDAFRGFDQTADFAVTPTRTALVKRGSELDSAGVAADGESLRRLSAAVNAAQMSIFRNKSTADLKLKEVATPADNVFPAIRTAFGDNAHLGTDLQPASSTAAPSWRVEFPFTAAEQQRLDQQMTAMPVSIRAITVGSQGAITDLKVGLPHPETAYQDLVSVIGITGAGPAHPLNLSWRREGERADTYPNFSGSVQVGACSYSPNAESELHPETYLTPDARELQQRLRKQYDTCPK